MGAPLLVLTQSIETVFDQIWCILQSKQDSDNIIHSLLSENHCNGEFLVLLGPIISIFFACSNEEKK
jgi:hypothetical protein